jgi:hypothetical protein
MVLFHRLMSNFHAFIGKGALLSDLKGEWPQSWRTLSDYR